jgi:FKBP-type peptidyl-prolyl cis-trans isomerase
MHRLVFAAAVMAAATSAAASPAGDAYLKKNAHEKGVVVMPGIQYKVLASGPVSGPHPKLSDDVVVHYEGRLIDGTVFDSSIKRGEPVTFPLKKLIPGWETALRMMRPGDDWLVTIPPELAYGTPSKAAPTIPDDSVLVFEIKLIAVKPPEAPPSAPPSK